MMRCLAALKPLQDLCTISGEHAGVHLLLAFPGVGRKKN